MTEYECYSLWINAIGIFVAIIVVIVAIFGERIRQLWSSPKLRISMTDPALTSTNNRTKGWYYLIRVTNERLDCPAEDVSLRLLKVYKKTPEGRWV